MDPETLIAAFLPGAPTLTPEVGKDAAKSIMDFFKQHIDVYKLDEFIDVVFLSEDGLISFLKNMLGKVTANDKQFNPVKEYILLTIKLILNNLQPEWKRQVAPICQRLMAILNLYWRNFNEPSKHQQLALDGIISMFENYEEHINEIEFDIPPLYGDLLVASEKSKYQPTVRGKIFHALGLIANITSAGMMNNSNMFDKLFQHIITILTSQVESKDSKLEVSILNGCLKAMDKLLQKFSVKINRSSSIWNQFYSNLEKIIDPRCSIAADVSENRNQLKRREFQRTGLELIANNGNLFGKEFFNKYEQWYFDILFWSKSNNASDSSVGRKAMLSYFESIVVYIRAQPTKVDSIETFVSFFINMFNGILASKITNRAESIVAVKGIGLLAPLSEDKVNILFEKILENIKKILIEFSCPIADKYNSSLSLIPSYLETASSLILHTEKTDNDTPACSHFIFQIKSVEQLAIYLMTFYPDLSEQNRNTAHKSVLLLMRSIHSNHNDISVDSVDRMISSALSQIIASPTKAELDIIFESLSSDNEKVGVKSMKSQIGLRGVSSYVQFWINITKHHSDSEADVVQLLYQRILSWSLSTIEKLDLSVTIEYNESSVVSNTGDIFSIMKANQQKDLQLFINLVDFLQVYIPKTESSLFSACMDHYISTLIDFTVKHPMISGLYKLLTSAFQVCRSMGYFKNIGSSSIERQMMFEKCVIFMGNLSNKIDEFRDELLTSILELWISTPDEMVLANDQSWKLTLRTIFSLGRVCLQLADTCADAFQRWILNPSFSKQLIEDLVKHLFPVWQSYFISEGKRVDFFKRPVLSKAKRAATKKKIILTGQEKQQQQIIKEANEVTLLKVQTKLLGIIGSFAHILDPESICPDDFSLSIDKEILKYTIPFQDTKPDVYIDNLIPKILELCETSTDRHARAAACEFFHTVVLYFLGYSVREPITGQHSGLFGSIFKTVMKLSGDYDYLVRQLFNPLASQCIHWFTKHQNEYANIVLQTIVDGLIQTEDTQLRDFSADSFSEYFKGTLKYGNKTQSRKLVNFIVAMSSHANVQYRLGSAIGFNVIYKDFREDMELWNAFTIQLLTSFLNSLAISSAYDEDSVVIKTTKVSIVHLERILVRKKDNFNNKVRGRKLPAGFTEDNICLTDLASWLLSHIGRPERLCREESRRLLELITPLIRGCGSLDRFVAVTNSSDAESLIEIAEKSQKHLDLASIEQLTEFMDASSESYEFFATLRLLNVEVFTNERSIFISSLEKFLTTLLQTTRKKDSKCETRLWKTSLRICNRFSVFMNYIPRQEVAENLMELVLLFGKFADKEIDLQNAMKICSQLPVNEASKKYLKGIVTNSVASIENETGFQINDRIANNKQLRLFRIGVENNVFPLSVTPNGFENLAQQFWKSIMAKLYQTKEDNVNSEILEIRSRFEIEDLEETLKLCLALGLDRSVVVDATFDLTNIKILQSSSMSSTTTKGIVFQKYLHRALLNCEELMNFDNLTKKVKIAQLAPFIEETIRLVTANRDLKKQLGLKLLQNTIEVWNPIAVNCDPHLVAKILSGLMMISKDRCRTFNEFSTWWCGSNVMNSDNLNFQEKCEFIGFLSFFAQSKNADTIISTVVNIANKIDPKQTWKECGSAFTRFTTQILCAFEQNPKQEPLLKSLLLTIAKVFELTNEESSPAANGFYDELCERLANVIISLRDEESVLNVCSIFEVLLSEVNCQINLAAINCLVLIVQKMTIISAKTFYKRKIGSIMSIIKKGPLKELSLESWNLMILAFKLLTLLPSKCGKKFVNDISKEYEGISVGLQSGKSSNMFQEFASFLRRLKEESSILDYEQSTIKETAMQCFNFAFQSAAINLLAGGKPPKVIELLLFHDDPWNKNKPSHLWGNLISCLQPIQFPVLIDSTISQQELAFDAIETNYILTNPSNDSFSKSNMNQLMKTRINLAGSSLAMDSSVFDFTSATSTNEATFYRQICNNSAGIKQNSKIPMTTLEIIQEKLIFKCSEFNEGSVIAFVQTLKMLAQATRSDADEEKWTGLLNSVLKGKRHNNVKIFILVAFLNCSDHIKPFGSVFKDSIIQFILSNHEWKETFNYFVKDLLAMLLSWGEDGCPSESLKGSTISFVLENISEQYDKYDRNDILQHSFNLLSTMLDVWHINADIISDIPILKNNNLNIRLPVFKVLIEKKLLLPNNENFCEKINDFCKCLTKASKISNDAAENIGLLLRLKEGDQEFIEWTIKKIQKESLSSTVTVNIVLHIQKHWPKITSYFKTTLFALLSNSALQFSILEILGNTLVLDSDEALDLFSELDGRKVFDTPCTVLKQARFGIVLFEAMLERTNQVQSYEKLIAWLNILQNENSEMEGLHLRYLKCAYNFYLKLQTSTSPSTTNLKTIEEMFVSRTRDENPEIRTIVLEFWKTSCLNQNTSIDFVLRLIEILKYNINSLEYMMEILINRCATLPEFQKFIFDRPLEDCDFQEYTLDTSWRMGQASFIPLFAESLSTQNMSEIPHVIQATLRRHRLSSSTFGVNMLNETLSMGKRPFSPTVENVEDDHFERMEVDYEYGPGSRDENETSGSSSTETIHSNDNPLRRRFYTADSNYFVNLQQKRNAMNMNLAIGSIPSRRDVKLVRNYRVGELPDIQLKNADFLLALKNLAEQDWDFGRMFLINLLSILFSEANLESRTKISTTIENILKNPLRLNPSFTATLIETCLKSNILISTNVIADACVHHGLFEFGILMLERHLCEDSLLPPPANKKARMELDESNKATTFLRIAEMYQNIEDYDVLKNIFATIAELSTVEAHKTTYKKTYSILSLESDRKWEDALHEYSNLFPPKNNSNHPSFEKFIEDAHYHCLLELSEWSQVLKLGLKSIEKRKENNTDLIDRRTLESIILAGINASMSETESGEDSEGNVEHNESSEVNLFREFLLNNPMLEPMKCHAEKGLMQLATFENIPKASLLLDKACLHNVNVFKMFSKLSKPHKRRHLQQLQLCAILDDMISVAKLLHLGDVKKESRGFISKFEKLINAQAVPFTIAEVSVSVRSYFLSKFVLHESLQKSPSLIDRMELLDFNQDLWIASLSLRDENFTVADNYIAKYKYNEIEQNPVLNPHLATWRRIFIQYLSMFHGSQDINDWLKSWSSAWKKINKSSMERYETVYLQSQLLHSILKATSDTDVVIKSKNIKSVNSVLAGNNDGPISSGIKLGCEQLLSLIKSHEDGIIRNCGSDSLKIYFLLESMEETFSDSFLPGNIERVCVMLKCLATCINSDNINGILLFPRVLQFLEKHKKLIYVQEIFNQLVTTTPAWKFLPWMDQIVTMYDNNSAMQSILDPLVKCVIKAFPNALRLQYPQLFPSLSSMHKTYSKSLRALVLPTILHKDTLNKCIRTFVPPYDVSSVTTSLRDFQCNLQKMLDDKEIFGILHQEYADEMISTINDFLQDLEEQVSSMDVDGDDKIKRISEFLKNGKKRFDSINESHNRKVFPIVSDNAKPKLVEMEKFSPWLSSFHQFNSSDIIEMPGLGAFEKSYTDLQENIVSFHPTVLVYGSITKPIKFTVISNNGTKKHFLAKYGDDLRQDRRIQQLFKIASTFFQDNRLTRERRTNIVSYSVAPLDNIFGIVEWVDKTVDMKSFILNRQELIRKRNEAARDHEIWINKSGGQSTTTGQTYNQYMGYCKSAEVISRQEAMKRYKTIKDTIPDNLFVNNLKTRSNSYEQFFRIRQSLIRSHASLSIVHWLLGIGDRHLENFLVSLESGQIIGIDFGRAFGTANSIQLIPEMVPFRLTPQIQGLMHPYGIKGLFRETMKLTWECLIKSSTIINFILKTFVDEDGIDWLRKRNNKLDITVEGTNQIDRKRMQMKIIYSKLKGRNPVSVLLEEIESHGQKNIIGAYCNIVRNGRESIADENLMSSGDLIDTLLDLATDTNILCRMYTGWSSWI